MRPPDSARLLPCLLFLAGMGFAFWVSSFFSDAKRPGTTTDRADLLAAEALLAGRLTADTPPSPAHWHQLGVLLHPETGQRHPLSRPASAITLAISGGNRVLAGMLAFGAAAAALGWLLHNRVGLSSGRSSVLVALSSIALIHGRDWQITDPFPFLVTAAGALFLGCWWRHRSAPATRGSALAFGAAWAGLTLCHPALALGGAICAGLDHFLQHRQVENAPHKSPPRVRLALIALPCLILLGYGVRNHLVTGTAWLTPTQSYTERHTSAPVWFWQFVRLPQAKLDPVMERYDELVAIPQSRFASPVYKVWGTRLIEGGQRSAGAALALGAVLAAFALPWRLARPGVFMLLWVAGLALLNYPFPSPWWGLLTAPLLALLALALLRLDQTGGGRAALVGLAVGQLALLPTGSRAKPTAAEYSFESQRAEVETKIAETPGDHLVFVRLGDTLDGRIEPARLPFDWRNERVLYARDLSSEQNQALVEALPNRTPWRIVVLPERIGLQPWEPDQPVSQPEPQSQSPEARDEEKAQG